MNTYNPKLGVNDYRVLVRGGLPCIAHVTNYLPYTPATWWEPADGPEVEFELRDLRGRPAPWIEKRLKEKEREELEIDLMERIDFERREHYYDD